MVNLDWHWLYLLLLVQVFFLDTISLYVMEWVILGRMLSISKFNGTIIGMV